MKNTETIYPDAVLEAATDIMESTFIDNEFFEMNQISDFELGYEVASEHLNDFFLKKFLNGSELFFENEEEISDVCSMICADIHLKSLKKKGLLNSYTDNGEEHYFLTEDGKEITKHLEKTGWVQ